MSIASSLDTLLIANGIPIISVVDSNGTKAGLSIIYDPLATPAQITQGNNILAAYDGITPIGYVDCTKTGATPIAFIAGANALFFPERYRIIVRTATGVITPPTLSIGTNSPTYDNVTVATALGSVGLTAVGNMRNVQLTLTQVVAQNLGVFVSVTVAAVATAFVVRVDVLGDFETR